MSGRLVLAMTLLALHAPSSAADNPASRFEILSDADCTGVERIFTESQPDYFGPTYLRVQFIGDPGTAELRDEVANPVTWDVGRYTGFHAPASAQRGYRDGPAGQQSAFQLDCRTGGFFINTGSFSHTMPVAGAGPGASIARRIEPAVRAFDDPNQTLILEARVAVPWVRTATPPTVEGAAQVSFVYYARDTTSGTRFAHVIVLFDNREGTKAGDYEVPAHDGLTAFIGSPLSPTLPNGSPTRFVRVPAFSPQMQWVDGWSDPKLFRAEIPYAMFRDMLARLRQATTSLSAEPGDYVIYLVGILGEVFPGTGTANEVSLGASASDIRLLRTPPPRRRVMDNR